MKEKNATQEAAAPKRKSNGMLYLKKNWQLYVLIILPLLFIFIFKYGAYGGLSIAFKNYKAAKGFAGSEWVGFQIFEKIFSHRDFGRAVKNTLLINLLDLFFSFPAPIILALLLNEIRVKWFKKGDTDIVISAALPVMGYYRSAGISAVLTE